MSNSKPKHKEQHMTISPRTQSLIDRLPKDHPLTPAMKAAMIAALTAGEQYAGYKIAIASDKRMTELGRHQALQDALTGNHGKAWARAKAPVVKARKEIKSRRSALVIKSVDPANLAAALERQEIRQWFRSLDLGVRQSVAVGTKDVRILEALVTAPPELSGILGPKAAAEIENRYIELTYPDELASIEAADAVVKEAEEAVGIAYHELRIVLGAVVAEVAEGERSRNLLSGRVMSHELLSVADDHESSKHRFDELMRPIEIIRPWLIDGRRQVCETGADGKPTYRKATEADLADGVEYENFEAYKRAQGLANAA
jgi:hypothetical protein